MKGKFLTVFMSIVLMLTLFGCSSKSAEESSVDTSAAQQSSSESGNDKSLGQKEIIRISTSGNHAFFSETNGETGELQGYEIDVWNEIAKRLGYEIEWQTAGFPGIIELLDSGRVDTVADQIGVTDERKKVYNFSDVYFYVPYRVVVAEDNNTINGIEDVYGKKLGLLTNDIAYSFSGQFDPDKKIEYVEYDDSTAVHTDVALGRIDASLMSSLHIEDVKAKSGLKIKGVGKAVYVEEAAYPFQKDERGTKLCEEVNAVLRQLKDEGFLAQTAIKWFGFNPME